MSANALRTYQSCPLRFRYRYLDQLYWSRLWGATAGERLAVERGEAFHLLARRYYAGVDPGGVADPVEQRDLDGWLHRLQGFLPYTFDRTFYPELELRLNRPDLKLMAKFDLLVVEPDGRALIFDWKTEQRLPKRERLEQNPQTLVYRYMLCAAGGSWSPRGRFAPGEVTMTYWNPLHPGSWEPLPYSEEQYRADEARLLQIVREIETTPRDEFRPTADARTCRSCEYRMLCHRRHPEQVNGEDGADELEPAAWDTVPDL
ncbi:MAG TPA: PD-(D/E)XK nuclease family protein [Symbiobacteriaceae bacterium]|jgi:hypothetical protein